MPLSVPYIFISHSTKDTTATEQVAQALQRAGVPYWVDDEQIQPGEDWLEQIEKGVRACTGLLILLSNASLTSRWVRRETLLADQLGKALFVARLEAVHLPLHIIELQYVDLFPLETHLKKGITRLVPQLNLALEAEKAARAGILPEPEAAYPEPEAYMEELAKEADADFDEPIALPKRDKQSARRERHTNATLASSESASASPPPPAPALPPLPKPISPIISPPASAPAPQASFSAQKMPRSEASSAPFFLALSQLEQGDMLRGQALELAEWAQAQGLTLEYVGKQTPTLHARLGAGLEAEGTIVFSLYGFVRNPALQVPLDHLSKLPPYSDSASLEAMRADWQSLGALDEDGVRPSLNLLDLAQSANLNAKALELLGAMVQALRT